MAGDGFIRSLIECTGLSIDDEAYSKLSKELKDIDLLEVAINSIRSSLSGRYSPEDIEDIVKTTLYTDFSKLDRDPARIRKSLSYDIFRRSERLSKTQNANRFEWFDIFFQRSIDRFMSAINCALYTIGLKKDIINIDNDTIKEYIEELRTLPCRRFGELNFGEICKMRPPTSLSTYTDSLMKKYENKAISIEYSSKIIDMMDKISNYPNYFRVMEHDRKREEIRPVIIAISQLQSYPGNDQDKTDLLAALGILLFNIFPSPRLVKYLSGLKPGDKNQHLSYEYYAILALNYLLMGKLDKAVEYNEKAVEYAGDEIKRAYSSILKSCIYINKHEYQKAINCLETCSGMVKDRRMRCMTKFYQGIVHYENNDTANALECFKDARVGIEDEIDLMNICNNIGTCAMLQGDLQAALKAFHEVDDLSKYMGSNIAKFLKSVAYGNMGIVYLNLNDHDRALEYYRRSLAVNKEIRNKKGIANQLGNIGLAYKTKQEFKTAIEYFKSMLSYSYSVNYLEGIIFAYAQVDQTMSLIGKSEEAEKFKRDIARRYPEIVKLLKIN